MSVRFTLSALIVLVAALLFARCMRAGVKSNKNDAAARAEALALFQKALAASDIRAQGAPPFELVGTIDVHGGWKDLHGTYLLKWAARDKWREEVHFPDYSRIRFGSKNGYFQVRNLPYESPPILDLSQALDFLKELHAWSRSGSMGALAKVKLDRSKVAGVRASCVLLRVRKDSVDSYFCFNSETGVLAMMDKTEFSDFRAFGGKLFPGMVVASGMTPQTIKWRADSIRTLGDTSEADFQAPKGATVWPACDDPDGVVELVHRVSPIYPYFLVTQGNQGAVFVHGVVDENGLLRDLIPIGNPDPGLTKAAITAFDQWKFKPETCNGKPVPTETILRTDFSIRD